MSSATFSSHHPRSLSNAKARSSVGSLRRAADAAGYGAAYAWEDQPVVSWSVGAAYVALAAMLMVAAAALFWLVG